MSLPFGLLLLVMCLALQGFFSGSEMALVSANRARLTARADAGSRGAALALGLLAREDRLLGTCLIGTNTFLVSGTLLTGTLLAQNGHPEEVLVTLVYVPFALTLGEVLPKTVYSHHADLMAPVLAWPLKAVQVLLLPLLAVVTGWSRALEWISASEERSIKREDIVQLLDEKSATIDADDRRLIQRLFAMPHVTVGQCMTPLVDVFGVSIDARVGDAIDVVIREGHSRLPVYQRRIDNIVGVISHRDLLYGIEESETIQAIVQPAIFVPETKSIDRLLREMRSGNNHFAVVVDEYGGSVGVVTIEDLLEEIVGEIEDERERAEPGIRKLGDREWSVPARTELEDLEDALGHPLPRGNYETVAGLLLAVLGRIPDEGQLVRVGRIEFRIVTASERAIEVVRVTSRD